MSKAKTVETETKVAIATGFRDARRLRRGDTFIAPVSEKGKWFVAQDSKEGKDAISGEAHVLDMTPAEMKAHVASMTSEDINQAISIEQGGTRRRNVLNILQNELDNRVGMVGGPDPAAKKPQEKDPLPIAGADVPEDDVLK